MLASTSRPQSHSTASSTRCARVRRRGAEGMVRPTATPVRKACGGVQGCGGGLVDGELRPAVGQGDEQAEKVSRHPPAQEQHPHLLPRRASLLRQHAAACRSTQLPQQLLQGGVRGRGRDGGRGGCWRAARGGGGTRRRALRRQVVLEALRRVRLGGRGSGRDGRAALGLQRLAQGRRGEAPAAGTAAGRAVGTRQRSKGRTVGVAARACCGPLPAPLNLTSRRWRSCGPWKARCPRRSPRAARPAASDP